MSDSKGRMTASDVSEELIVAIISDRHDHGSWANSWDIYPWFPDVPWKVVRARICSMIRRRLIDGCNAMHDCRGDWYLPGSPWDPDA